MVLRPDRRESFQYMDACQQDPIGSTTGFDGQWQVRNLLSGPRKGVTTDSLALLQTGGSVHRAQRGQSRMGS